MRQEYEVIESRIVDSIHSLKAIFSRELAYLQIDIGEQEKIVESIKKEIKGLENVVYENIQRYIEWQEYTKTQEYQDMNKEFEYTETFCLDMWHEIYEIQEAPDLIPKVSMGFNTRDKDEALRKAEYMLVSTGYNKGIVFNRYESIHIVLKDETIEIIQHIKHTDTENKGEEN
ncbi:MAG: hypothetical protein SPJ83_06470 [Helicobacter sp.]|uniref:hypothetical protein n=1 Tax=Helicobacter sp. TaxID=218 RepID=UPI002A91587A|nr:hypothetical protein [Helicobacter sp.]MDY5822415.1 hypothetical protein [Helicobacter sp.]